MSKLYTYQIFNNTAAGEGRPWTEDDLDDIYTAQIRCDNDYEALEAVYQEMFPYGNPYQRDYVDYDDFPDVEDYIEFFEDLRPSQEVPLLLDLRQGNRIIFNLEDYLQTSFEEILEIYEDDDDEYEN